MIATITFHRAINCGAALQSYALQCAIEDIGEKASVIDYRCKKLEESYKLIHTPLTGKSLASDILHFPMQAIREHKFRLFQKKYISVTAPCYTLEDLSEIEKDFSMIITGSDQVWNLDLTGHDKAFFLNFTDYTKRASYAASVGKKELYKDTAVDCRDELKRFEFLSVREDSTAVELCEKLGKIPEVVVDPVFLLKVEQWNRIVKESKSAKPYIFVYCLHELSVYDEAKRLSEKTGLPIVCVPASWRCPVKGKIIRDMGPQEFVSAIRSAEYVVTDSFHAAAFSIIYNRKLIPILKKAYPELNERLTSLIKMCGLDDVFELKEEVYDQVKYSEIGEKLNTHIERSKDYLKRIVDRGRENENQTALVASVQKT